MRAERSRRAKVIACLATVYIVWGSSFLFTKVAVNHLPIALFSAIRFLAAGSVLALVARFWRGDAWPATRLDCRHVLVSAFLMVFTSNGLNAWAIQFLPTNEAALLNGTAAFWIAGLGVFGPRGHPLSRSAILGLCVGFAGTALMLAPPGARGGPPGGAPLWSANLAAEFGVLGACLAFSVGTLYYRSIDTSLSPLMFMAMQLCGGGGMLLMVAVVHGDPARWTYNTPGLVALGYLTFFSSCLAFTAYGWLTRHTTPAVIGTYSYVNPALAAFLGWQFLGESLSRSQLLGMMIIIAGVSILTLRGGPARPTISAA